jgi:hypothetical protein
MFARVRRKRLQATETRQTYSGPLAVGEDLMAFEIGETVTVRRYQTPAWPEASARVA